MKYSRFTKIYRVQKKTSVSYQKCLWKFPYLNSRGKISRSKNKQANARSKKVWCARMWWCAKQNTDTDEIKYFFPLEQMFDVVKRAHIATGHGGRDRMAKETRKNTRTSQMISSRFSNRSAPSVNLGRILKLIPLMLIAISEFELALQIETFNSHTLS